MNDASGDTGPETAAIEAFINRWTDTGGKERANYQLFLTELSQLLDLPGPEPATENNTEDTYVFERRVDIRHPDGTESRGYIDLYKRGHFVLVSGVEIDPRAATKGRPRRRRNSQAASGSIRGYHGPDFPIPDLDKRRPDAGAA